MKKELQIRKTSTGKYIVTEKPTPKKSWFEKFYDFMSEKLFDNKKTIFAILLLIGLNSNAQQINALVGYKSIELGYIYTDEETELIYGISASIVGSDIAERRANTNDKGKHHEFNGTIVPAVFGNIGAKFDRLNIIGKIGGSYVSQSINGQPTKDLYLALGVMIAYEVNDRYSIIGGYDSVNAVQLGISIKL